MCIRDSYIGITEPGIIAAESPNPIVNHLVIMPDIEKRLEAFVRVGHGILVFPGGVGTAEEILYLLGILLREENAALPFPLILTGPTIAAPYFEQIDKFIRLTLGDAAAARYEIVIGDPVAVAKKMTAGIKTVSYTHLDVYKRQVRGRLGAPSVASAMTMMPSLMASSGSRALASTIPSTVTVLPSCAVALVCSWARPRMSGCPAPTRTCLLYTSRCV